jgi:hypothetical protein
LLVFRGLPSIGAGGRFSENRGLPGETAPETAPHERDRVSRTIPIPRT